MSDILLLHKDTPVFTIINKILAAHNHEGIIVHENKSAIKALESNYQIDLILLDGGMELRQQLNMLDFIHKKPKFYFIPAVVISNNCGIETIRKLIDFGVYDVISSSPSVDEDNLMHRIEKALDWSKPKILFVEENELLVGHFVYISDLSGFKGEGVSDCESALEKIKSDNISVVVLDIVFTRKYGLNIIAEIKEHTEGAPVVLLATHNISLLERDAALSAGADGYLTRPFKNTEFVNLIRYLLMHNRHANNYSTLA